MGIYDYGYEPRRRSLKIGDRKILWREAKQRCQNPYCKKKIDYDEMQVGHKKAYSKRGSATLGNSVCLCWRCNNQQRTDSWEKFLKKQAIAHGQGESNKDLIDLKKFLKKLSMNQLKYIAKKHFIKVKGSKAGWMYGDSYTPASKTKYVSAIAKEISSIDKIKSEINGMPKPKKKKRRKSDSWW